MRSIHLILNHLVRRRGSAGLSITLLCAGFVLADRFPPDPVEEVRQALRAPGAHTNLAQRVQALRTLPDMRRALSLQDWHSEVGGTDEDVYEALADPLFAERVANKRVNTPGRKNAPPAGNWFPSSSTSLHSFPT